NCAGMEHLISAIQSSYDAVIDRECENTVLLSYMSNDKQFKIFIKHLVINYQPYQKQRINIFMVYNESYQNIENDLFEQVFVSKNRFQKAYKLNNELILSFHNGYHDLLFEGNVLDTDEKVEGKVIEPIIQKYDVRLREMLEGGEN